jgi:hypothetical protein
MSVRPFDIFEIRRSNLPQAAVDLAGGESRHLPESLLLHLGNPTCKRRVEEEFWRSSAGGRAPATRQSYVSRIRGAVLGDAQNGPPRFTDGCYLFGPELADLHLPKFHQLIRDTTLSSPEEGNPRHVLTERLAHPRLPPDRDTRVDRCSGGNQRSGPEQLHQRRPRRPRADHRGQRHRSPPGRAGVRASAEPAITTRRCNPALSPIRTERKYS